MKSDWKYPICFLAAGATVCLASCDMMLESGDAVSGYDVGIGAGPVWYDDGVYPTPWYAGFGNGGWNIGGIPPSGPPPVFGPVVSPPHPPGVPSRPAFGPSLQRPNRPVPLPDNRPILPDLNGSDPGPVIRPGAPTSGQRPGAPNPAGGSVARPTTPLPQGPVQGRH